MSNSIASVELDQKSLNATLNAFKKFGKDSEKVIKDVVNRTAIAVANDAKTKLKTDKHIITSRLRSSIHAEIKSGQSYSYGDSEGKHYDGSLHENFGPLEAIAGTNVSYAADIEFGSKPHEIKAKPGKVLAFSMAAAYSIKGRVALYMNRKTGRLNKKKSFNTMIFVKSVKHPGFKGDSFLRWAAEKQRPLFLKRMNEALNNLIGGYKS